MNTWTKMQFAMLSIQIGCLIILIVTKNNYWLIGAVGLVLPNLYFGYKSIKLGKKNNHYG